AVQEERAVRPEEAAREKEPQVLQVALAPAPVTAHLLEQRRRHLLVAAAEVVREPERPPGAAHERRLDEIVAQDLAAERLASRQAGQSTMVHEGLHADDRVVPPVL